MKKKIKLLKEYGGFNVGDVCEVDDDGAKQLIEDGIAELYVKEIDLNKVTDEIAADVKDAINGEADKEAADVVATVAATAKDADEKFNWKDTGFFTSLKDRDAVILNQYANFVKATGNNEAIDSEGGFLVPDDIAQQIMEGITNAERLAPLAADTPINNTIERPFVEDWDKSSSWFGGVAVYWVGEGVAPTASTLKFGKYRLRLHKLGAVLYGTDELLADSVVGFEALVTKGASYALAKEFDEQIVNGSGAAQPLGLLNCPAKITVTAESGQGANTIVSGNILDMRMRCSNFANAVWLINSEAYKQVYTMTITVGTGGAPLMLFNIAQDGANTLLGRPILWSEHTQALGTEGDIILTDLSQYNTASKAGSPGIVASSSIHVKFLEGEQTFKFTRRVDGQCMWKQALTPKHGSNTVSPIVTLNATRT